MDFGNNPLSAISPNSLALKFRLLREIRFAKIRLVSKTQFAHMCHKNQRVSELKKKYNLEIYFSHNTH